MNQAWWFVNPDGELVALGSFSELRMTLDGESRESPLVRKTELSIDLKLTEDQWRAWARWIRGERRYLRLRQQHKAKGRGKKWRRIA